jgi:hypothetical protein
MHLTLLAELLTPPFVCERFRGEQPALARDELDATTGDKVQELVGRSMSSASRLRTTAGPSTAFSYGTPRRVNGGISSQRP